MYAVRIIKYVYSFSLEVVCVSTNTTRQTERRRAATQYGNEFNSYYVLFCIFLKM